MTDWCPDLSSSSAPRYIAIADSIESDLSSGHLSPGDRLPAQRNLATLLGLDFTTVARGYTEARRRGLISSQVGSGTFVSAPHHSAALRMSTGDPRRLCPPDYTMNLPPEPDDAGLIARMQEGFASLSADLIPLLRYQSFETSELDQVAAARWLEGTGLAAKPEQILFSPGAQAALTNILATLTSPGDRIACESVTYPGIRAICAQLHLELCGLTTDDEGVLPDAFEATCRTGGLKALYLNPTLHNPTAATVPYKRRKDLASIAERNGVPIIEDDAYGPLSRKAPLPFAAISPANTWYVASLSKSLGAGLRLAYVLAPSEGASWQFSRAVRTMQVMPSAAAIALATRWIEDGTAHELLERTRSECAARQALASKHLKGRRFSSEQDAFHLWLTLEHGWNRAAFVSQLRGLQIGLVEADAFTVEGNPLEAVRVGLGGPVSRDQLSSALKIIAQTLNSSPARASVYF